MAGFKTGKGINPGMGPKQGGMSINNKPTGGGRVGPGAPVTGIPHPDSRMSRFAKTHDPAENGKPGPAGNGKAP